MIINLKNKDCAKIVQEAIGVKPDGIWGPKSQMALVRFQEDNNLVADGILGPKTLEALGILDTDLQNQVVGVSTENYFLPKSEYITQSVKVKNEYVFLHHTAGWNNPFDVINSWANDKQGRVATEFVIGGLQPKTGESSYDGRILRAFPEGCQGYHLGNTKSKFMNEHSVGIEMCNFGYLTEYNKTYTGVVVQQNQITTLDKPFRGYTKWHSYSDGQLKALRKLLLYVANRDNIDLHSGLIERIHNNVSTAFDYDEKLASGKIKGLLSHGNVRKDKFDVFPQPELIDMLLTL